MGDSEMQDAEAAVGLGCALESFAEAAEVKGETTRIEARGLFGRCLFH
jgi:hypothetical protein